MTDETGKADPIKLVAAQNGVFIEEGHSRIVAAGITATNIPMDSDTVQIRTIPGDFPNPYEWQNITITP
ncbi:MAG: hypothetical protein WCF84_16205 [Anaerolineae bacterium]